jgi:TRAP-type C4-dicarboxylate transport system substrate-binding protein
LFLTTIIINKDLWENTLTEEQRQIIQECAQIAAVEEREASLVDGANAKEQCLREGIEVVEWDESALAEFRSAVEPIHEQFNDLFSDKDLINRIKKA